MMRNFVSVDSSRIFTRSLNCNHPVNEIQRPENDRNYNLVNEEQVSIVRVHNTALAAANNTHQVEPQNEQKTSPVLSVTKRNARERRRVLAVNQAYAKLKLHLPAIRDKRKRVSKLKILKAAISYMYELTDILADIQEVPASDDVYEQVQYPGAFNNWNYPMHDAHCSCYAAFPCPLHVYN